MASLVGPNYDSSGDESDKPTATTFTSATKLVAAPEVNIEVWSFPDQNIPIYSTNIPLTGPYESATNRRHWDINRFNL